MKSVHVDGKGQDPNEKPHDDGALADSVGAQCEGNNVSDVGPSEHQSKHPPASSADQKEKEGQAGVSKAAEATDESPSVKEDMEVEEINQGSSSNSQDAQDSDNSASEETAKVNHVAMERRSSKRQRTSTSNRYSPGEGGGLASKKPKVVNESVATASNVSKSAAPTAPSGEVKANTTEKASRGEKGGNDFSEQKPAEWSEPKYRWMDGGVLIDGTPSTLEHQGVEIDFTNSKTKNWTPPPPFVVCPGDVVMLSSGDAPWEGANQPINQSPHNQPKREVLPIYNDPATREAGLGTLDPFIGYVERLWEEADDSFKKGPGQRKKKGKSTKTNKPSKMMIRTRWFFKKEDVEGIKGGSLTGLRTGSS